MKRTSRLTPEQRERMLIDDAPNPSQTLFRRRVDAPIAEAIGRGEWSNLRGKGKPLDLRSLTLTPEERAQKLLKDAGFVPDWIALRKQIEAISAELRDLASRANSAEEIAALDRRCGELNELIRKHNRLVPSPLLQHGLKDVQDFAGR